MITGVVMALPSRVCVMMSKSVSRGGGRVADRHPHVHQTRELLLHVLNHLAQAEDLLHLLLRFLLVDIDHLELAAIASNPLLTFLKEFDLSGLWRVPGHISQLGILPNLVCWPGTDWLAIDVDIGFLSHVDPDNLPRLWVRLSTHLVKGSLKAGHGGLSAAVDLVTGHPAEVGAARDRVPH